MPTSSDSPNASNQLLAIVHMSDLHVRNTSAPCLLRAEQVTAALRPVLRYAATVIFAWTGDLSYSGQEHELAAVRGFMQQLLLQIQNEYPGVQAHLVVVPGNHDCDFSTGRAARDIVLDKLTSDGDLTADVIASCNRALDTYRSVIHGSQPSGNEGDGLVDLHKLQDGNGNALRVVAMNTAWCSRLHERPGRLHFKETMLPDAEKDCFTIVLLHHPLQWLEPNNAKRLRRRFDEIADLVLTGHEHEADARIATNTTGNGALYVEGGIFEVEHGSASTFNVLLVDTNARRFQYIPYSWDSLDQGFRSSAAEGILGDNATWPQLPLVRRRHMAAYTLSPEHTAFLLDPGINIEHPIKGRLSLDHIYTAPDLRTDIILADKPGEIIRGHRVVPHVLECGQVLIRGDSQTGKTALAKKLFCAFREAGYVPVFLECPKKPVIGSDLDKLLRAAFLAQYSAPSAEAYSQLSRNQRAIVVDDFHVLSGKPHLRRRFRDELAQFADHVVMLGHDMLLSVADALGGDGTDMVERYAIMPMSHARRGELVERWVSFDSEAEPREVARTIQETCRLVDAIIGKNFVPAYPPYVLALLQAKTSLAAVDANAGSHGYFYELLVRCALARETQTDEFDMLMSFLVHIAKVMLFKEVRSFTESELRDAHQRFEDQVDVTFELARNVDRLKKRNILHEEAGEIRFKYRYLFYYFVALHFRDSLQEESTRSYLKTYAENLHIEEHANVLLFVTHLTKDPFVIDQLLAVAAGVFSGHEMATLENTEWTDCNFAQLEANTRQFLDTDPDEARRRAFAEMDESQRSAEIEAERLAAQGPAAEMIRVGQALAVKQILGQILKNFPGTLEAERKVEIVRAVYGVGRRFLKWYFELVRENHQELIQDIARVINSAHPRFSVDKIIRRAQELLSGLIALTSFGIVKRVSSAVGAKRLARTYQKVREESAIVNLFDFSIQLDHTGEFPIDEVRRLAAQLKGAVLPMIVLRALVTQHLQLFPVDFATKQAACAVLDMKFDRTDLLQSAAKLLDK